MEPSHYLNQCWLIINHILWHSPQDNFTWNAQDIFPWYAFENYYFNITAVSPRGLWINALRLRQNGHYFPNDIFKCIFLNEIVWILIKISLKFAPEGSINKIPALVQIMAWWQAIIWINDGPDHWRIYASLGLNELNAVNRQSIGTLNYFKIWGCYNDTYRIWMRYNTVYTEVKAVRATTFLFQCIHICIEVNMWRPNTKVEFSDELRVNDIEIQYFSERYSMVPGGILKKKFDVGVRLLFSIGYPWLRRKFGRKHTQLAKGYFLIPSLFLHDFKEF